MSVRTPSRHVTTRPPAATPPRKPPPPRREWWQGPWLIIASVAATAAVVVGLVAVGLTRGASSPSPSPAGGASATPDRGVAASVVDQLSSLPAAVFDSAGDLLPSGSFQVLHGTSVRLGAGGRPLVFYAGADYCPYCAAERWSLVVALQRFGLLSNVGLTTSSSTDIFPDTSTFSFSGSSYTSDLVDFSGLETEDRSGRPLSTPSAEQRRILTTYDVPPYVSSAGAIPLIDIGDRFLVGGSGFNPKVLAGMTWQQIAAAVRGGQGDAARGIILEANYLTAAICRVTGDQPAAVCSSAAIRAVEQRIVAAGG